MSKNVYQRKQELIQEYYQKIKDLEVERKSINSKLSICKEKFEELIYTEADLNKLSLFENLDEFLKGE